MAITKQKGDIAEAFVTFLLKEKGFNVLVPWGEDVRYDLVSEKNGIFKRIQVKYVTPKNGVISVFMRSANNHKTLYYSKDQADIIAAYSPTQNDVYFIPIDSTKKVWKLRLRPTKNKQTKNVVLATKYRQRFSLLEK